MRQGEREYAEQSAPGYVYKPNKKEDTGQPFTVQIRTEPASDDDVQSTMDDIQTEVNNSIPISGLDMDVQQALNSTGNMLDQVQGYVSGNPTQGSVNMPNGVDAGINFASEVQRGLNSNTPRLEIETTYGGGTPPGYAEGGRATQPSIFGEAGAEWAIPEEHSRRTAELLNAARAASGFTWPDLLARFGGLNADAAHKPATLIYSPTINAQDVRGVESALAADKRRFEKWMEERDMHNRIEVYA